MKKISLSINPLYLCNFSCEFCYLTPKQLKDKSTLDLKLLSNLLFEVKNHGFHVEHVDLYGGEIGLLSEEYLNHLDQILFKHSDPTINIITNFSRKHSYFLRDHIDLSVSFDFEIREKMDLVLSNILTTNKNISILMLASKELIKKNVDEMIHLLNSVQNIVSVEIKPYSTNQSNQFEVTNIEFEEFVKKWIDSSITKKFNFINSEQIKRSLEKSRNAYSDDHVYITPKGKFSVLEFDDSNHEYFLELNHFSEYIKWSDDEKNRVSKNKICKSCEYLGKCLTEHYREVIDLNQSCNGFKGLLDYYKKSSLQKELGTA